MIVNPTALGPGQNTCQPYPTSSAGGQSPAALLSPQMAWSMPTQGPGKPQSIRGPRVVLKGPGRGSGAEAGTPVVCRAFWRLCTAGLLRGPLQVKEIHLEPASGGMHSLGLSPYMWLSQGCGSLVPPTQELAEQVELFSLSVSEGSGIPFLFWSFGRAGHLKDSCCDFISKQIAPSPGELILAPNITNVTWMPTGIKKN